MRILIVEDELACSQTLTECLKRAYVIDSTTSGTEAISLAMTNEYDLIILDIELPDKCGFQVCQEIRAEKITTPILVLSGYSNSCEIVKAFQYGADDYVIKPFSFSELQARITALLRRSYQHHSSVISIGELSYDLEQKAAVYGNLPVTLNRKELLLLEYLMMRSNKIVTRSMIADHVWDDYQVVNSNSIDVYISSLRKKIDKRFGVSLIHTIPGIGYKLCSDSP